MIVYVYNDNKLPKNVEEIIKEKERYVEVRKISENNILELKRQIIVVPKNKKPKIDTVKNSVIKNNSFFIFENPENVTEEILTHMGIQELKRRIKSIENQSKIKKHKIVKLYASIIFEKPAKYLTEEELEEAEKQLIEKFKQLPEEGTTWEKIKKFEYELNDLFLRKRGEKVSTTGLLNFLKRHNLV